VVARLPSSSSEISAGGEDIPGMLTPTNMALGFEGRVLMWFGALVFIRQANYNVYWDVTGMEFAVLKMREKVG